MPFDPSKLRQEALRGPGYATPVTAPIVPAAEDEEEKQRPWWDETLGRLSLFAPPYLTAPLLAVSPRARELWGTLATKPAETVERYVGWTGPVLGEYVRRGRAMLRGEEVPPFTWEREKEIIRQHMYPEKYGPAPPTLGAEISKSIYPHERRREEFQKAGWLGKLGVVAKSIGADIPGLIADLVTDPIVLGSFGIEIGAPAAARMARRAVRPAVSSAMRGAAEVYLTDAAGRALEVQAADRIQKAVTKAMERAVEELPAKPILDVGNLRAYHRSTTQAWRERIAGAIEGAAPNLAPEKVGELTQRVLDEYRRHLTPVVSYFGKPLIYAGRRTEPLLPETEAGVELFGGAMPRYTLTEAGVLAPEMRTVEELGIRNPALEQFVARQAPRVAERLEAAAKEVRPVALEAMKRQAEAMGAAARRRGLMEAIAAARAEVEAIEEQIRRIEEGTEEEAAPEEAPPIEAPVTEEVTPAAPEAPAIEEPVAPEEEEQPERQWFAAEATQYDIFGRPMRVYGREPEVRQRSLEEEGMAIPELPREGEVQIPGTEVPREVAGQPEVAPEGPSLEERIAAIREEMNRLSAEQKRLQEQEWRLRIQRQGASLEEAKQVIDPQIEAIREQYSQHRLRLLELDKQLKDLEEQAFLASVPEGMDVRVARAIRNYEREIAALERDLARIPERQAQLERQLQEARAGAERDEPGAHYMVQQLEQTLAELPREAARDRERIQTLRREIEQLQEKGLAHLDPVAYAMQQLPEPVRINPIPRTQELPQDLDELRQVLREARRAARHFRQPLIDRDKQLREELKKTQDKAQRAVLRDKRKTLREALYGPSRRQSVKQHPDYQKHKETRRWMLKEGFVPDNLLPTIWWRDPVRFWKDYDRYMETGEWPVVDGVKATEQDMEAMMVIAKNALSVPPEEDELHALYKEMQEEQWGEWAATAEAASMELEHFIGEAESELQSLQQELNGLIEEAQAAGASEAEIQAIREAYREPIEKLQENIRGMREDLEGREEEAEQEKKEQKYPGLFRNRRKAPERMSRWEITEELRRLREQVRAAQEYVAMREPGLAEQIAAKRPAPEEVKPEITEEQSPLERLETVTEAVEQAGGTVDAETKKRWLLVFQAQALEKVRKLEAELERYQEAPIAETMTTFDRLMKERVLIENTPRSFVDKVSAAGGRIGNLFNMFWGLPSEQQHWWRNRISEAEANANRLTASVMAWLSNIPDLQDRAAIWAAIQSSRRPLRPGEEGPYREPGTVVGRDEAGQLEVMITRAGRDETGKRFEPGEERMVDVSRFLDEKGRVDERKLPVHLRRMWRAVRGIPEVFRAVYDGEKGFTMSIKQAYDDVQAFIAEYTGEEVKEMGWLPDYVPQFGLAGMTPEEFLALLEGMAPSGLLQRLAQQAVTMKRQYASGETKLFRAAEIKTRAVRPEAAGEMPLPMEVPLQAELGLHLPEEWQPIEELPLELAGLLWSYDVEAQTFGYAAQYKSVMLHKAVVDFLREFCPTVGELRAQYGDDWVMQAWRLGARPPEIHGKVLVKEGDIDSARLVTPRQADIIRRVLANSLIQRVSPALAVFRDWLRPLKMFTLATVRFLVANISEQLVNLGLAGVYADLPALSRAVRYVVASLGELAAEDFSLLPPEGFAARVRKRMAEIAENIPKSAAFSRKKAQRYAQLIRKYNIIGASVGYAKRVETSGFVARILQAFKLPPAEAAEASQVLTSALFGWDDIGRVLAFIARMEMGDSAETAARIVRETVVDYSAGGSAPIDTWLQNLWFFYRYRRQRIFQFARLAKQRPGWAVLAYEAHKKFEQAQGYDPLTRYVLIAGKPPWMTAEWKPIRWNSFPVVLVNARPPEGSVLKAVDGDYVVYVRLRIPPWEEPSQWRQFLEDPTGEFVQAMVPPFGFLRRWPQTFTKEHPWGQPLRTFLETMPIISPWYREARVTGRVLGMRVVERPERTRAPEWMYNWERGTKIPQYAKMFAEEMMADGVDPNDRKAAGQWLAARYEAEKAEMYRRLEWITRLGFSYYPTTMHQLLINLNLEQTERLLQMTKEALRKGEEAGYWGSEQGLKELEQRVEQLRRRQTLRERQEKGGEG